MRILDAKTDFYDFYSKIYRDDAFTFDRRGSYILKREDFMHEFYVGRRGVCVDKYGMRHAFVMLQCGFTYWLFDLSFEEINNLGRCTNYKLSLVETWKDYKHTGIPLKFSIVSFPWNIHKEYGEAVKRGEYEERFGFNHYMYWNGYKYVNEPYPILKEIGIAALIDGKDVYFAIEEYFSLQVSARERIETDGLTDEDKVLNHGFDAKTSFRGKG